MKKIFIIISCILLMGCNIQKAQNKTSDINASNESITQSETAKSNTNKNESSEINADLFQISEKDFKLAKKAAKNNYKELVDTSTFSNYESYSYDHLGFKIPKDYKYTKDSSFRYYTKYIKDENNYIELGSSIFSPNEKSRLIRLGFELRDAIREDNSNVSYKSIDNVDYIIINNKKRNYYSNSLSDSYKYITFVNNWLRSIEFTTGDNNIGLDEESREQIIKSFYTISPEQYTYDTLDELDIVESTKNEGNISNKKVSKDIDLNNGTRLYQNPQLLDIVTSYCSEIKDYPTTAKDSSGLKNDNVKVLQYDMAHSPSPKGISCTMKMPITYIENLDNSYISNLFFYNQSRYAKTESGIKYLTNIDDYIYFQASAFEYDDIDKKTKLPKDIADFSLKGSSQATQMKAGIMQLGDKSYMFQIELRDSKLPYYNTCVKTAYTVIDSFLIEISFSKPADKLYDFNDTEKEILKSLAVKPFERTYLEYFIKKSCNTLLVQQLLIKTSKKITYLIKFLVFFSKNTHK